MSTKVLLIGARLCRNLGGPSLLVTVRHVIDQFVEDAEYILISPNAEDLSLIKTYDIPIIPAVSKKKLVLAALLKKTTGLSLGPREVREELAAFAEADIVIDIFGIGFADTLFSSTFVARASEGAQFFVGKLFRKLVVKYTADLGPFETRWNRFFTRLYFRYTVDLILARNDITKQRLVKLGLTTPTKVCPDTAFLLESHTSPFAEELASQKANSPIVGFSVSHMAYRQSNNPEKYLDCMAGLAEHIVESIGALIIFIPNELSEDITNDDAYFTGKVRNKMKRKKHATILTGEYTAQQLKGVFGQCDVVVAARYHSIVASISQGIPVLAIGWHTKYPEVLRLVCQEQYLCSIESVTLDNLIKMFDNLWQSGNQIRKEINALLPSIHKDILRGGELVSLLLGQKINEAL